MFFINKLKKEEISKIIIVGNGLEDLLSLTFDKDCFSKSQIGKIAFRLNIRDDCETLNENIREVSYRVF